MSLLEQASLVLVPSGYKEDIVYSQVPTNGDGDLTFTRASDATRVNSAGLIERVPWNLWTYSEDLSNAAWVKTRVTITSNSITAPNGTLTADKLIANTDNLSHFIDQPVTSQSGIPFVVSVYAKEGEYSFFQINNQVDNSIANFNLSNGTLGTVSGYSATIESVGDGWYRCTAIKTFSTAPTTHRFAAITSATSARLEAFIGNGTSGFYLWGAQTNEGTLKPYFPTTDRLNVPRLDYSGGGCPKLLLEPQRTNVLSYSEQFENVVYTKSNVTITSNAAIAPDGTMSADKLVESSTSSSHVIFRTITGTGATISFFAKAAERNWVGVLPNSGGVSFFNIANGTLGTIASGSTATITPYANGWYRCTLFNSHVTYGMSIYLATANGTEIYTGDGTSGAFIWGAQLEASSTYPTSYIPTNGAAATRVADSCSKTGISDLIGQTEGTLFAEVDWNVKPENGSPVIGIVTLNNGVNNLQNSIVLGIERNSTGINTVYCFVTNSNVTQAALFGSNITDGSYKIAFAYKANDFALYVNGTQVATDTSGSVPTTSEVLLGKRFGSDTFNTSDGINQAIVYKTRLTNSELATLTTL